MIERIASWENLTAAYEAVRKTKRTAANAAEFHADWAGNIAMIRRGILDGTISLSPCERFTVNNYGKLRQIEAPVYADRIVHHAIVQVISPMFERRFISDSYSCRIGKGNHAAVRRAHMFLKRLSPCYVMQCDVKKFFPSVHHDTLMIIIERTVKDTRTLELIRRMSFTGGERGIPIGALTSQLFGNVYMDVFDHFMKDDAGARYYVRYADDFLVFDRSADVLRSYLPMCGEFLRNELKLELNGHSGIYPDSIGVDFCGYRIWDTHIKPRKRVVKRFRIGIRGARISGDTDRRDCLINSLLGYMRHCAGWRTSLSAIVDRGAKA